MRSGLFLNVLKSKNSVTTLKRWNNLFQNFISVLFHVVRSLPNCHLAVQRTMLWNDVIGRYLGGCNHANEVRSCQGRLRSTRVKSVSPRWLKRCVYTTLVFLTETVLYFLRFLINILSSKLGENMMLRNAVAVLGLTVCGEGQWGGHGFG